MYPVNTLQPPLHLSVTTTRVRDARVTQLPYLTVGVIPERFLRPQGPPDYRDWWLVVGFKPRLLRLKAVSSSASPRLGLASDSQRVEWCRRVQLVAVVWCCRPALGG